MNDFTAERSRLRDYLNIKGVEYDAKNKTYRCPNHADENPSAVLYDNPGAPVLWCPVCQQSWSIFDVCGILEGHTEFKDMLKSVRETLNITEIDTTEKSKATRTKKPPKNFDALSEKDYEKLLSRQKIQGVGVKNGWGEITGSWKYFDADRNLVALDVRFENESKKTVITFFYDGKLKWSNTPIFIYNLPDALESDKPIVIHEGAKCADIGAENLPEFTHISWNGGAGKAGLADWSALKDKRVFILQDDDDAGKRAAENIKKQLTSSIVIPILEEARKIKASGADIEEYLKVKSAPFIRDFILNSEFSQPESVAIPPLDSEVPPPLPADSGSESSLPFKILGIGADGFAAFITEAGRLEKCRLDSLSKNKLVVLASREYWKENYCHDGKFTWDSAIDDIIRIAQNKDFDETQIRGRGAWRDGDDISYHDGINTAGKFDNKKIYLRLPYTDIGIKDNPASPELITKIKETVFKLSFETPADAVRCLGWSVLAPFAGALKYRPAMLITGASGTGKSTVANLIIKKISNCLWFNGSESTVAGVRGKVKHDSTAIVFEETEKDTQKKALNRNELFSLMRVNVTEDAPDTVKGTKDGGYNSFKMQNIFGFVAIDPTVDSVADENRIFRINMSKPKNASDWKKIETDLFGLLCDKNCRAIRALTWNNLKNIFDLSDRIVDAIRDKTGRDYRSSYSDALLASAFMCIWSGTPNPSDEQINNMLDKYYSYQPADEHRDEAEEMIDRLLDEVIEIIGNHDREKITIRECLTRIKTGKYEDDRNISEIDKNNYISHAARYGLKIHEGNKLALSNNHHAIQRILQVSSGYSKILKRYGGTTDSSTVVYFQDGKNRRCSIIENLFDGKEDNQIMEIMF